MNFIKFEENNDHEGVIVGKRVYCDCGRPVGENGWQCDSCAAPAEQ